MSAAADRVRGLFEARDYDAALADGNAALTDDPADIDCIYWVGRAHEGLHQWAEAIATGRRMLDADPGGYRAHWLIGVGSLETGDLATAEAAFRRFLAGNDRSYVARAKLAEALLGQKRYAEALDEARAVVASGPDYRPGRRVLGRALWDGGDHAGAERVFRELIEDFPDFNSARRWLGVVLAASGRPGEAKATFREAIERDPDDYLALGLLGGVLRRDHVARSVAATPPATRPRRPATIVELQRSARQVVAEMFNVHSHASDTIAILTRSERAGEGALRTVGTCSPDAALVRRTTANPHRMVGLLRSFFGRTAPLQIALAEEVVTTLQALCVSDTVTDGDVHRMRSAMNTLLHENIHASSTGNRRLKVLIGTLRRPAHYATLMEGAVDALTTVGLNDFIMRTGMADRDGLLLCAPAVAYSAYVAQAEFIRYVAEGIASILGGERTGGSVLRDIAMDANIRTVLLVAADDICKKGDVPGRVSTMTWYKAVATTTDDERLPDCAQLRAARAILRPAARVHRWATSPGVTGSAERAGGDEAFAVGHEAGRDAVRTLRELITVSQDRPASETDKPAAA